MPQIVTATATCNALGPLTQVVNRFTPEGKIRHLDIYEQAKDSGDWIKDAAKAATA